MITLVDFLYSSPVFYQVFEHLLSDMTGNIPNFYSVALTTKTKYNDKSVHIAQKLDALHSLSLTIETRNMAKQVDKSYIYKTKHV